MKTSAFKPFILGSFGLAISAIISSCADPYAYSGGPPQTTVTTTYRTGYEVTSLPSGYRTEIIEGTPYYVYNHTYYRPRSGRYVVVEAPRGYRDRYTEVRRDTRYDNRYNEPYDRRIESRVVTQLPSGYRTVVRDGVRYYQVRDTYYQQRGNGYVIVSPPY